MRRPALPAGPARQLINHPQLNRTTHPSHSRRATLLPAMDCQDSLYLLLDLGVFSAEHRATAAGCHDPAVTWGELDLHARHWRRRSPWRHTSAHDRPGPTSRLWIINPCMSNHPRDGAWALKGPTASSGSGSGSSSVIEIRQPAPPGEEPLQGRSSVISGMICLPGQPSSRPLRNAGAETGTMHQPRWISHPHARRSPNPTVPVIITRTRLT